MECLMNANSAEEKYVYQDFKVFAYSTLRSFFYPECIQSRKRGRFIKGIANEFPSPSFSLDASPTTGRKTTGRKLTFNNLPKITTRRKLFYHNSQKTITGRN